MSARCGGGRREEGGGRREEGGAGMRTRREKVEGENK